MHESHSLSLPTMMVRRFAAAAAVFLFVYAITYLVARYSPVHGMVVTGRGYDVPGMLQPVGTALAEFAKKGGRYPRSLKELFTWGKREGRLTFVAESGELMFRDPWGNTFQYHSNERSYRIYTIGRDGDIGGIELTGNLDRNAKGHVCYKPTLHEFLYESRHSDALRGAATVSSLIAGVMCFFLIARPDANKFSLSRTVLLVVITVASTTILSMCFVFMCMVLE